MMPLRYEFWWIRLRKLTNLLSGELFDAAVHLVHVT